MFYFFLKAALSGVIIAIVSEVAKPSPALGALVASLPLISILGMVWLWHDTRDLERLGAHAGATFRYVLPSLPMFLLIPALLKRGVPFWAALGAGCGLTICLYLTMTRVGPRFGLRL